MYFYLKDMVNDGRIPAEEVDQVIPFTRLHVKKEDDEMVVLVLRWIELEGIIDDVQKKIQRMLDKPQEVEVKKREAKEVIREQVGTIENNLTREEEEGGQNEDTQGGAISGLVSGENGQGLNSN